MNVIRKLSLSLDGWAETRARRLVKRRGGQEDLDMLKLAWCCHYYNSHKHQLAKRAIAFDGKDSFRDDNFNEKEEYEIFKKLPLEVHQRALNTSLNKQIMELFHHVHKQSFNGINPYPPPRNNISSTLERQIRNQQKLSEAAKILLDEELSRTVYRQGAMLAHPAGYNFQIRKSQIDHPDSGYGVFVEGHVIPGTVVGFYPGTVYYPRELTPEVTDKNEYMISRYDGIVIDGRKWAKDAFDSHQEGALLELSGIGNNNMGGFSKLNNNNISDSKRTSVIEESLKKYRNPFAVANFMNHPPLGKEPNVLCYSFDFMDRPMKKLLQNSQKSNNNNNKAYSYGMEEEEEYVLPEHLRAFIPNKFTEKKHLARWLYQKENVTMHSMVAIATRHIGPGEELLLNYRYNPKMPYPTWYHQPDAQEATRRWAPRSYFDIK